MSGFTPDQLDFLMGGLHKVQSTGPGGTTFVPVIVGTSIPLSAQASLYTAYAASNCNVIKSSIGTVFSMIGTNVSSTSVRYLQLHNTASVVASGAVPMIHYLVNAAPGQTIIGADALTLNGAGFPLGVTYAWSSVPLSFVPVQGGDVALQVYYE